MPAEFEVPQGLTELLQEFTVAVLRAQPKNLTLFAKEYFDNKAENMTPEIEVDATEAQSDDILDQFPSPHRMSVRRHSVAAERYDPEKEDTENTDYENFQKSEDEKKQLENSVKPILLFKSLDEKQLQHVINAMQLRDVDEDEVIITEGDDVADYFYVINSGSYEVYVNGKYLRTYEDEGSFGELALMYNTPRAATIKAKTKGQLWTMNRISFRRIVLKTAYMKRKAYEEFIEAVPVLSNLEPYERMNICDALKSVSFENGTQIIKQGDQADCMYFVEDGEVSVHRKSSRGVSKEVSRLKKGDYFGEMGLLSKSPRAADVFSVGKTKCAVLDIEAFERLLGKCMDIMRRNSRTYHEDLIRAFGSKENIAVAQLR